MEKITVRVKGIVKLEDKYLLVNRWYDDRIVEPYQWEFIDGKMEFAEGPDKAVVRTVKECTGIDVVIGKILYTWSYVVGDVCNVGISYECLAFSSDVILSEELHDFYWAKKEEFSSYIENKKLLEDIAKAEL